MSDLFLYHVQMPILFTINFFNIYAIIWSVYIYLCQNKNNKKIHKYQKRDTLFKYIYYFAFCIIIQYMLQYSIIMIKDFILIEYKITTAYFYQAFIIYLIDDIYFYFFHRLLHTNKFLYNNIHKIHHTARSPYPINYIYAHPFEIAIGAGGTLLGIMIQYQIYSVSLILFGIIKIIHEIYIHSGIICFQMKNKFLLSYIGCVKDHDIHHYYLIGNYGSNFNFMDRIFGTYITNKYD